MVEFREEPIQQMEIPYSSIQSLLIGSSASPCVTFSLAEAPRFFLKELDTEDSIQSFDSHWHVQGRSNPQGREEDKRRTLQHSDIASALAKSDMFDFLIDIVPREEAASHAKRTAAQAGLGSGSMPPSYGDTRFLTLCFRLQVHNAAVFRTWYIYHLIIISSFTIIIIF